MPLYPLAVDNCTSYDTCKGLNFEHFSEAVPPDSHSGRSYEFFQTLLQLLQFLSAITASPLSLATCSTGRQVDDVALVITGALFPLLQRLQFD